MLSFTTNGNFIDFKYTEDQYPFYFYLVFKLHNTSRAISWSYNDNPDVITFTVDESKYENIPITSIYFDGVVMANQAAFKTGIEAMFPGYAGGGGGGNTIYTGDGTLAGNRIIDGASARGIAFNNMIQFGVISENVSIFANGVNGILHLATTDNGTSIIFTDATQTIAYTATGGHTFNGNVGIGRSPSPGELFIVNDTNNDLLQINSSTFFSELQANNQTASVSFVANADLGGGNTYFDINANDGANSVDIYGDAIAQTINITAGNGVGIGGSDLYKFGAPSGGAPTPDSKIRVTINGTDYDIAAQAA